MIWIILILILIAIGATNRRDRPHEVAPQVILVHVSLVGADDDSETSQSQELEAEIEATLNQTGAGTLAEREVVDGECILKIMSADAVEVLAVLAPILNALGPPLETLLELPSYAVESPLTKQAVVVHLRLDEGKFGTDQLLRKAHSLVASLAAVVRKANAGELDTQEIGGGEYVLYLFGSDASKIELAIAPLLSESAWRQGGYLELQDSQDASGNKVLQLPRS